MSRHIVLRLLAFTTLTCLAPVWGSVRVSAQSPSPRTVLAIHWGAEDFPATPVVNEAIREAFRSDPNVPIHFFVEHLESDLFPPDDAAMALRETIRWKYRSRPIDLVIAIADPALQFALDHRDELFPHAPIVFSGVGVPDASTRRAGAGLTAVMRGAAYAETLKLALDLHPSTERVFVVARGPDDQVVNSVHASLDDFSHRVNLTYVEAETVPRLLAAVRAIPPRSLVLYIWYSPINPGSTSDFSDIARQVARASPAPLYGTNERYVGLGIVGGVIRGTRETGTRVGEMALEILEGARAQDIPVEDARLVPTFDSRQLERWGIDEGRLPPGSSVEFRTPSLWREHRTAVLSALGAGVFQFGLIVGLLYERRARRLAEDRSRHHLAISAHLERQLAMGALAAALAHELNQPLTSILSNAEAANMLLSSNRASVDEIREILRDIHREDMRASQIIQRQRAMLRKHEPERRALDLNAVVRESLAIVARDAESRQVRIDADLCSSPCMTTGDQILLQQVVLNLMLNAMDAMAETPAAARRMLVRSTMARSMIEVSVRDCGGGIEPDIAARLFEPFRSTKAAGMGIGLTIVRDIVEAHGGTIEARNNDDGGATFAFRLPLAAATIESGDLAVSKR
jgi:signal transduction histidine kinase